LDSSTLSQSNQSDGWSKEREGYREQEGSPAILVQFLPQISYILFVIFSYYSKLKSIFPDDLGIILAQPAAAC
jgi:hypothetical protein